MLDYLVYLLTFVIGSILGLLYSYKLHGEPFIVDTALNSKMCIVSIIGWVLGINSGNIVLGGIGFLLAGFVMGERPGYGRKETAIGLVIAIIIYLLLHWTI
ncbi:energy-converting hydrogenase subunit EhaL family protein [Methanobrevibacter sp.]|uniref:energy-converting hydrogenase subunit EhaL family protein n=1 Tax=Methanobrevibacter sp. TaxID=66852 RepID=UPI003890D620